MIEKLLKENKLINAIYVSFFKKEKVSKEHWCRVVMNNSTKELINQLNVDKLNVLEISGSHWKNYGFKKYTNLFFPEFDICENKLDKKFDLIIAEQVFEHLKFPYRAGKNIYNSLNPGGYFLITTPFMIKIHKEPLDCSRWSQDGIKYFLNECGFDLEEIVSSSWGNKNCLIDNLNGWKHYNPKNHSLENEEDFPLVVWALAKKK